MFRWIGNQILPKFSISKSNVALLEDEIPPCKVVLNESHPTTTFGSKNVMNKSLDRCKKSVPSTEGHNHANITPTA